MIFLTFSLQFYRTNKLLPPFPCHIPDFNTSMMKAPKDQSLSPETLPNWCKVGAAHCTHTTIKFLNFQMPDNFAVIKLKLKPEGNLSKRCKWNDKQ